MQEGGQAAMRREGYTAVPLPLLRLRDLSMAQFKRLLEGFFQQPDEALLALAGEAENEGHAGSRKTGPSDLGQALQWLRQDPESLILSYQQWLARAFNDCARSALKPAPEQTLLSQWGREEQLAIKNLASQLRQHYGEPAEMIRLRLQKLLRLDELPKDGNPLDPQQLCLGLAEACADLAMPYYSQCLVYRLFGPVLVAELGPLYSLANQLLIREGVMPDRRHPEPPLATGHPGGVTGDGNDPASPGFTELSALVRSQYQHRGPVRRDTGVMPTEELIQRLSDIQASPEILQGADSPGAVLPLKERVSQWLALRARVDSAPGQKDWDVIHLVTMLFDFILRDRQLPEAMKSLLARLQIPLLKVALLDRSFFSHGGHPARQLLNAMATAALGWNSRASGLEDPLRDCLEQLVQRVNREFTDNIPLFETLLEELTRFTDQYQRRGLLLQRRLQDAEEGRARQALARQAASALVAELWDKHALPQSMARLLKDPWQRVLQWHWLQWGEASTQWQEISRLTGLLIWSLDPQPVVRSTRNDLLRRIPEIVDGVRRGLNAIAWDPFAIDEWVRELELLHVATLQQLMDAPAQSQAAGFMAGEEAGGIAAQEVSRDPVVDTGEEQSLPHPAWMERARAMGVGSWVEWHSSEGRQIRCKLAAVIKASGRYIFVNRSGAKVMDYSEVDVARALEEGVINPLDDTQIFDRALASVIDSLRHSRRS